MSAIPTDRDEIEASESDSVSPRFAIIRVAVNALLFLAGFAAVATLLRPQYPDDAVLRAKLDYFEEHKDEYDVVFFGSSRFYRAINPRVFERELGRAGVEMRAFNFGVGHMRPHELNSVIHRILAMRPKRLKYVVVEVMDWSPTILEGKQGHDRTVAWHTPRETLSACRTVWLTESPTREKVEQTWVHVSHMTAYLTNYGRGPARLKQSFGDQSEHKAWKTLFASADGFVPLEHEVNPGFRGRREIFLKTNYDLFVEQVEQIPAQNAQPGTLAHFNLPAQLDQQRRIREAGVTPIYMIPNLRWGTPNMNRLYLDGHLDHVVHYNHPLTYPEIYNRENYWDRGHLKWKGANLFTATFARDFAAWLREHSRQAD